MKNKSKVIKEIVIKKNLISQKQIYNILKTNLFYQIFYKMIVLMILRKRKWLIVIIKNNYLL